MIVELETGCWLADGEGDPPRTLVKKYAKYFSTQKEALKALEEARKHRPFNKAVVEDEFL